MAVFWVVFCVCVPQDFDVRVGKLAFEAEHQKDTGSGDSATPQVPPTSRGAQGATGASPQFIDESFLPQREQLSVEEFNRLNQPRRRKGDSQ